MTSWREIDLKLRSVAARRAALDVEEARWLRAADDEEIHLRFGCVTLLEYLERVLGYGPKVAKERLRVARALEELPVIESRIASGELAYSAVRELTRVCTPATEQAWVDSAVGKTLRDVEELVAGHVKGDLPTDPKRPDLRLRTISFQVRPEAFAALKQAERKLEDETGAPMDDSELIHALARLALEDA